MRLLIAFVMAVLTAAVVSAAPVDGKWGGSIDTPNGPTQIGFTFLADGTTLTGSTTGPDGNMVQIKNGKIDGEKLSFVVDLDFGGMPLTIAYTGILMGDQIKLTLDFMGMPFDFVVKRAS